MPLNFSPSPLRPTSPRPTRSSVHPMDRLYWQPPPAPVSPPTQRPAPLSPPTKRPTLRSPPPQPLSPPPPHPQPHSPSTHRLAAERKRASSPPIRYACCPWSLCHHPRHVYATSSGMVVVHILRNRQRDAGRLRRLHIPSNSRVCRFCLTSCTPSLGPFAPGCNSPTLLQCTLSKLTVSATAPLRMAAKTAPKCCPEPQPPSMCARGA